MQVSILRLGVCKYLHILVEIKDKKIKTNIDWYLFSMVCLYKDIAEVCHSISHIQ